MTAAAPRYRVTRSGYLARDVRQADGSWKTVLAHREVVERHIGRSLRAEEHVHHVDGDPSNNSLSNLRLLSKAEHCRTHFATGVTRIALRCRGCGAGFVVNIKRRKARYCSRSCSAAAGGRASRARAAHRMGVLP